MSHLAAVLPQKGGPLEVTSRPTPTPGPHDLLIAVKSIALNPIDYYQRDFGFPPLAAYPAVVGSDIAGTVVSAGSDVLPDAPKAGTRKSTSSLILSLSDCDTPRVLRPWVYDQNCASECHVTQSFDISTVSQ